MKIINYIRDFEITFTGGYAIFVIMCVVFILGTGVVMVLDWLRSF